MGKIEKTTPIFHPVALLAPFFWNHLLNGEDWQKSSKKIASNLFFGEKQGGIFFAQKTIFRK